MPGSANWVPWCGCRSSGCTRCPDSPSARRCCATTVRSSPAAELRSTPSATDCPAARRWAATAPSTASVANWSPTACCRERWAAISDSVTEQAAHVVDAALADGRDRRRQRPRVRACRWPWCPTWWGGHAISATIYSPGPERHSISSDRSTGSWIKVISVECADAALRAPRRAPAQRDRGQPGP